MIRCVIIDFDLLFLFHNCEIGKIDVAEIFGRSMSLLRICKSKMNFRETATVSPIDHTTEIVAAYVSNNSVSTADLPALISSVYAALIGTANPANIEPEAAPLVPAVSVKKSVTDDYIICLEDGKKFKSLKRHITTHYDLTPEAYRAKWKLPADYPMVAPAYAAQRSALAKTMGLGRKPAVAAVTKAVKTAKARAPQKAEEAAE